MGKKGFVPLVVQGLGKAWGTSAGAGKQGGLSGEHLCPLVPGGVGLVCDGVGHGCAADTRVLLCTVQPACAFSLVAWQWAGLLAVITLNKRTSRGSESCSDGLRVPCQLEFLMFSPGANGTFLCKLEQAQVGCSSVAQRGRKSSTFTVAALALYPLLVLSPLCSQSPQGLLL